jgi:dTDP-4-dehydrorhamnose reductase
MKYLIAGASGQLAKAFISHFDRDEIAFEAPPESAFDITDARSVETFVETCKPDVILNCAAYNAVDTAERDPAPAFRINAEAVETLAAAAARHSAILVHYGTDYVFDGATERPYREEDETGPLNAYGKSKLAGEQAALNGDAEALLLRVSWAYGSGNQNFFHKMLEWSEGRDVLKVVWDQISVPTYTEDIVTYTLAALEHQLRGLYHLTNSGYATRYEVARHFFKCIERDTTIIPVGTDAFPSPAERPFFSAMSNDKLSSALDTVIPTWEDAVSRFAQQIAKLH